MSVAEVVLAAAAVVTTTIAIYGALNSRRSYKLATEGHTLAQRSYDLAESIRREQRTPDVLLRVEHAWEPRPRDEFWSPGQPELPEPDPEYHATIIVVNRGETVEHVRRLGVCEPGAHDPSHGATGMNFDIPHAEGALPPGPPVEREVWASDLPFDPERGFQGYAFLASAERPVVSEVVEPPEGGEPGVAGSPSTDA